MCTEEEWFFFSFLVSYFIFLYLFFILWLGQIGEVIWQDCPSLLHSLISNCHIKNWKRSIETEPEIRMTKTYIKKKRKKKKHHKFSFGITKDNTHQWDSRGAGGGVVKTGFWWEVYLVLDKVQNWCTMLI